jgi:hypothetical protein
MTLFAKMRDRRGSLRVSIARFADCSQHAFAAVAYADGSFLQSARYSSSENSSSRFFEAVREAAVNIHATSLA